MGGFVERDFLINNLLKTNFDEISNMFDAILLKLQLVPDTFLSGTLHVQKQMSEISPNDDSDVCIPLDAAVKNIP